MASSGPSAATLEETARTFFEAIGALDKQKMAGILSPNVQHEFGPKSLAMAQGPPKDAEALTAHMAWIGTMMSSFPMTVKKIWPNPSLNQVVAWTTSKTNFHDSVRDNDDLDEWTAQGEYIFVLDMDATGTKIEHILEFLDSKVTEGLLGLAGRAQKKLQGE